MNSPRFAPVARRMVSEEIRDALLASIESGALAPGALLPSERALCADFGVARTSVREAVRSLLALGRIHKVGNRFHVVERLPEVGVDPGGSLVRELFECRRVIETAMVRFAATRSTPAQRVEVRQIADIFTEDMDPEEFRHTDRLFHGAIARCCGNPALGELHGKVLDRLFTSEEFRALTGGPAVREVIARSCAAYRRAAEAVWHRNPDKASQIIENYLQHLESTMDDHIAQKPRMESL